MSGAFNAGMVDRRTTCSPRTRALPVRLADPLSGLLVGGRAGGRGDPGGSGAGATRRGRRVRGAARGGLGRHPTSAAHAAVLRSSVVRTSTTRVRSALWTPPWFRDGDGRRKRGPSRAEARCAGLVRTLGGRHTVALQADPGGGAPPPEGPALPRLEEPGLGRHGDQGSAPEASLCAYRRRQARTASNRLQATRRRRHQESLRGTDRSSTLWRSTRRRCWPREVIMPR